MPVISLLTDFGTDDEYVGLVKAVIYGIAPDATVVDLCHRIEPHDIAAAAILLDHAWPYFPECSVHLAVVDPGVGSPRDIVAVRQAGQIFVAPDNGLLSRILAGGKDVQGVKVQNRSLFRAEVSRTFHGRDVFAPVGAHLIRGVPLENLGPPVDAGALCRVELPEPALTGDGVLAGTVVWIDRFGNLITDIDEAHLARIDPTGRRRGVVIEAGGRRLPGPFGSYAAVAPGEALAIFGSRGTLEIAVNQGSAAESLGCGRGDPVRVYPANSG